MGKYDKNQSVEGVETSTQEATTETAVATPVKVETAPTEKSNVEKPRYKHTNVKIGLNNRTKYNLTVVFSTGKQTETVMIAPSGRTKKEFIEANIQSVNNIPLAEAHRKGLVSILR